MGICTLISDLIIDVSAVAIMRCAVVALISYTALMARARNRVQRLDLIYSVISKLRNSVMVL